MYSIFYGKINNKRKWDENHDPYSVLIWKKKLGSISDIRFFIEADKFFTDKIKVDWGSFAWKATRSSLIRFSKIKGNWVDDLKSLDDDSEYGVLFIEEISGNE